LPTLLTTKALAMSPESPADRPAPGGVTLQPGAVDGRVLSQQLEILARQGTRTTLPVAAVAAAIAYLIWGHVSVWLILPWAGTVLTLNVGRSLVCSRIVRRGFEPAAAPVWKHRFLILALLSGTASGSIAVLAFPDLSGELRAVITMIVCLWGVATVTTNGPFPRLVLGHAGPIFGLTALGWVLARAPEAPLVALLLVLFFALLVAFAVETARVIEQSILLRYANEELLAQKEQLLGLMRAAFDKAESARNKAEEASRSKSQFLASASHDLRQPLHALSLLTALLNDMTEDVRVREVGRHIELSVQSLDGLFGALLDLSKLDAGAVKPELREIALHELIDRLSIEYQPKAQSKGLIYECDADRIWIRTDPILLERVIRNLLENAIRFTHAGRVAVYARRAAEGLSISVSDTGIGIADAERARIFEEFYQIGNPARSRTQGLGLGLSIVRRLSDLLGFQVVVSSRSGQGSVFAIKVPDSQVQTAPTTAAIERPVQDADDVSGIVVLVIEDDAEVRNAMNLSLCRWGCTPLIADSLEEARKLLDATRLRPDVLICDLRLGNGASGIAAIDALRTALGPVPAALVTGDTDAGKLAEVRASGLDVLHKPVKSLELRALLYSLARPASDPALQGAS
jgi:signal transduction histidine kinase/ActR/RegA family two-component response regulator